MDFYKCSICHVYFQEYSDASKHLGLKHSSSIAHHAFTFTFTKGGGGPSSPGSRGSKKRNSHTKKTHTANQLIGMETFRIPMLLLSRVVQQPQSVTSASDLGKGTKMKKTKKNVSSLKEIKSGLSKPGVAKANRVRRPGSEKRVKLEEVPTTRGNYPSTLLPVETRPSVSLSAKPAASKIIRTIKLQPRRSKNSMKTEKVANANMEVISSFAVIAEEIKPTLPLPLPCNSNITTKGSRKRKPGPRCSKEVEFEEEDVTTFEPDTNDDESILEPEIELTETETIPTKRVWKRGRPKKDKHAGVEIKLDTLRASEIEALMNDLFTSGSKSTKTVSVERDGYQPEELTRHGRTIRRKVARYVDLDEEDENETNFNSSNPFDMKKVKRRRKNLDAEAEEYVPYFAHSKKTKRLDTSGRCKRKYRNLHAVSRRRFRFKVSFCYDCENQFADNDEYTSHMDTTHRTTEGTYSCSLCSSSYSTLEEFGAHKKDEMKVKWGNDNRPNISCDTCQKSFQFPSSLKLHLKSGKCPKRRRREEQVSIKTEEGGTSNANRHTIMSITQCYICELAFANVPDYVLHMTETHRSPEGMYHCPTCSKNFENLKRFGCHMKHHFVYKADAPQTTDCHFCGKTFKFPYFLKEHLKFHEKREEQIMRSFGKIPFRCPICSVPFGPAKHMKRHILVHVQPENSPYACKFTDCKRRCFTQPDHLKRHVDTVHFRSASGLKRIECSYCGKGLSRVQHLQRHHQNFHKGQPLKFSVRPNDSGSLPKMISPGKSTVSITDVDIKKEPLSSSDDMFRVELESIHCGDEVANEDDFEDEMEEEETGRKTKDEEIPCSEGLFNDPAVQALIKAYPELKAGFWNNSIHLSSTSYRKVEAAVRCNQCSWTGSYYRQLQNHMKTFHNEVLPNEAVTTTLPDTKGEMEELRLMCGACGFEAKMASDLEIHMEKEHSSLQQRPFPCTFCGLRFVTEKMKNKHIQRIHLSEKQYPCPHCPKKFGTKQNFTTHLKFKHNPNQPEAKVQCKECGRVLLSEFHYRIHVKNIHEGNKSKEGRQCKICGQVLATRLTLRRHIKTLHAHVSPYVPETTNPTATPSDESLQPPNQTDFLKQQSNEEKVFPVPAPLRKLSEDSTSVEMSMRNISVEILGI